MRYLEILLLVISILLPFFLHQEFIKKKSLSISISLLALFLAHLILEGFRWQMSPIYLAYSICLFCVFRKKEIFIGNWLKKSFVGLCYILLISLGYLFATIFPIFQLPAPTGPYQVGARYIHCYTDDDEVITQENGDKRTVEVKVWYPAFDEKAEKEKYLPKAGRLGFAKKYNLPGGTFSYLDYISTHTYKHAEPAEGIFPVLLFSHGYNSNAFGYHAIIEEIVSQGYIVFNINHTYESVGATSPDGKILLYDKVYEAANNNEEMAKMIWEAMEGYKNANTIEDKKNAINYALKNYYAAAISNRWEKDIAAVTDQISQLNKTSFLASHMDESRIGLFGHSQGGSVVGQALFHNAQLKAGVNIDGVQWGFMSDTTLTKPYLYLSSDWPESHPDFNEIAFSKGSNSVFYKAKIAASGHSNFMDIPYMINLPAINEAGNIPPKNASKLTADLVVSFFNRYVKDDIVDITAVYKDRTDLSIKKIE